MTKLADQAGVAPQTVWRLVHGVGKPSAPTVRAVATVLRVSPSKISEWAGLSHAVQEDWRPPAEAALLTPRQRRAIEEVIRAMLDDEAEADATVTELRAAYQPGTLSAHERLTAAQDEAAETPDAPGTDDPS